MKNLFYCMCVSVAVLMSGAMMSCSHKGTSDVAEMEDTQLFVAGDTCVHLSVSVSLEVPSGKDEVSAQICDSLVAEFIRSINNVCYSEEELELIPPCEYNRDDIQALVDYYEQAAYERMLKLAKDDYEERMAYLKENTELSDEDRESIENSIPQWAFDQVILKTVDAPAFAVYDANQYVYCGGAHGGVFGTGAITFDKASGQKIEQFFEEGAEYSLQSVIRQGLRQYYRESGDTLSETELLERLMFEGDLVPLPQCAPYLNANADSLIFTYGQYEIACYADGTPYFAAPVSDVISALTPEVTKLVQGSYSEK